MTVLFSIQSRRALLGAIVMWLLAGCSDPDTAVHCALGAGGRILAVGDSLTNAYGADDRGGWAEQLQSRLGSGSEWPDVEVIVAGVNGEQTGGLLARLPELLSTWQPSVVYITSGGNDFIRKVDERQTSAQLSQIIALVNDAGAMPVLFAVPQPGLAAAAGFLSDHPLFGSLSDQSDFVLIDDVVSETLSDESLRSDRIHPNSDGYARLADAAYDALAVCR